MPCDLARESPRIKYASRIKPDNNLCRWSPVRPGVHEAPPMSEKSGKATILVVDDEVSLRQLLARQLRSEDYVVLEAGYGLEALEVARSSSKPIDLVLS